MYNVSDYNMGDNTMRRRSLKNDKNDDAAFRHSRDRHMGVSISDEFYQPVPMFFTREGAHLSLIGHYRGGHAFLICNGPSFASLDRTQLNKPGIMTFGINNGPKTYRPNFWTCVDDPVRFLKSIWLDPKITKFVPQAHFEKPIFDNETWEVMKTRVGECPNVIGYRRNEKFVAERFLFESSFNWGNHKDFGGGRSVMLPALRILFLLGFRKVYLLGCDMKMTEKYAYHFDEQRSKGAVNCNMSTYDRLKSDYLPALKPVFDAEGFNVFNCNPNSELKVFPYLPFEDAIKEATKDLGDVPNERVWGMYSTPDEKPKWKQEPPKEQKVHLETLEEMGKKNVYEKPSVVIPFLSPIVPPAPVPFITEKESNGCDDNTTIVIPVEKIVPSIPPIVTSLHKSEPKVEIIAPIITPRKNFAPDECRASGEVRVIQSDIKRNPSVIKPPINIPPALNPVRWNPFNKVVQDHRSGTIDLPETNKERTKRGLITPWTPEIGEKEVKESPIQ